MADDFEIIYSRSNEPLAVAYRCPACGAEQQVGVGKAGMQQACSECGVVSIAPGRAKLDEMQAAEQSRRAEQREALKAQMSAKQHEAQRELDAVTRQVRTAARSRRRRSTNPEYDGLGIIRYILKFGLFASMVLVILNLGFILLLVIGAAGLFENGDVEAAMLAGGVAGFLLMSSFPVSLIVPTLIMIERNTRPTG